MTKSSPVALDPGELKVQEVRARDDAAEGYADFIRCTLGAYGDRAQLGIMLHSLQVMSRSRVLDAGCGVGRLTIPVARRVRHVLALDFSSKSIDVLRGQLRRQNISNVEAVVGDLASFDLPHRGFDVVICASVMQHIPSAEMRLHVLRRFYGWLKPGGRIGLLVYRWGGVIDWKEPQEGIHSSGIYYHAFTPQEVGRLVEDAGFKDVGVQGFLSLPSCLIARFPGWLAPIEPLLARLPWSSRTARFLMVTAHKRIS